MTGDNAHISLAETDGEGKKQDVYEVSGESRLCSRSGHLRWFLGAGGISFQPSEGEIKELSW